MLLLLDGDRIRGEVSSKLSEIGSSRMLRDLSSRVDARSGGLQLNGERNTTLL